VPSKRSIDYDMQGIADVLASDDFRVPIYQRSYAWKDDTVDDFLSDLQGSLNSNDPDYFLGTLVLTPSEDDKRLTVITASSGSRPRRSYSPPHGTSLRSGETQHRLMTSRPSTCGTGSSSW